MNKINLSKTGRILAAVIFLILGIILLKYPTASTLRLAQLVGIILIIQGILSAVSHFWQDNRTTLDDLQCLAFLVVSAVGAWVFFRPALAMSIIPLLLALFLLVHSLLDLLTVIELFKGKIKGALYFLIPSLLILALSILLLIRPLWLVLYHTKVLSFTLIADGILSFWMTIKLPAKKQDPTD